MGGVDVATRYSSSRQEFLLNIHWVPEIEWLTNQTVSYTAGGGCLHWKGLSIQGWAPVQALLDSPVLSIHLAVSKKSRVLPPAASFPPAQML